LKMSAKSPIVESEICPEDEGRTPDGG